jgi:hypothetical protein
MSNSGSQETDSDTWRFWCRRVRRDDSLLCLAASWEGAAMLRRATELPRRALG